MAELFAFFLILCFILAIYAAVSALGALVGMLLWNYIAVQTHHPDAQVSFLVAWAAFFLLAMVFHRPTICAAKK